MPQTQPNWYQMFSGQGTGHPAKGGNKPPQGTAGAQPGGQVWNGQAWGQASPTNPGQPYTAPYSFPRSTREWEENILTNPGMLNKAGENPLGLNAALLYALLGQREANQATEEDFKKTEGILYRNREHSNKLLDEAGGTALEDEQETYQRERGGLDQDLINRGLTSTTVNDSLKAGLNKNAGRRREEIRRNTAREKVGNTNLYAQLLAQNSASRQRIFNPGIYSQLAGAASASSGPGKTAQFTGLLGSLGGSAIGALLG